MDNLYSYSAPMPSGYMQQQQQLSPMAMRNIQVATNALETCYTFLSSRGEANLNEVNILRQRMQSGEVKDFQNAIYKRFGDNQPTDQVLVDATCDLVRQAVMKIRMELQQQMYGIQQPNQFGGFGFNQFQNQGFAMNANAFGNGMSMMNKQYSGFGNSFSNSELRNLYEQNTGFDNSQYQAPAAPSPQTPAAPTPQAQPTRIPTGEVLKTNGNVLKGETIYVKRPEWLEAERDEVRKAIRETIAALGETKIIKTEKEEIKSYEFKLNEPVTSELSAMATVAENIDQDIFTGPFAHVIDYDELVPLRMNYAVGKAGFDEVMKAIEKEDDDISKVNIILKTLKGSGEFGDLLEPHIIKMFNDAVKVNFVKIGSDFKATGLNLVKSYDDFDRLIRDTGDPQVEAWKGDQKKFIQALVVCLKASFLTIFDQNHTGYLNMDDDLNKGLFLADDRTGILIGGKSSRCLSFLNNPSDDTVQELAEKLRKWFPLVVRRTVLYHNLDLKPKVKESDRMGHWIKNSVEGEILRDIYNRRGSIRLFSRSDIFAADRPLLLGVDFNDMVHVRRIV